jgi:hypothetical protein
LGEGEGAQDAVADVGNDLAVGVAGEGAELLPFGVGTEGAPEFFARGERGPAKASPKKTGSMPRRSKMPISASLNILILRASETPVFDS